MVNPMRSRSQSTKDQAGTPSGLLIAQPSAQSSENSSPHATNRFDTLDLTEAVDRCVDGSWDMPDFQRGFVWKPDQAALLADSLWRNYPIGFILLWAEPSGEARSQSWIADGQQRLTSLCLLCGKRPQWWGRRTEPGWSAIKQSYDIRFDIEGEGFSRFLAEHQGMSKDRFIPVPDVLQHDPHDAAGLMQLQVLAARAKSAGHAETLSDEEVLARLIRVAEIREKIVLINSVSHPFRDVIEIFDRLNSRGVRFRWLVLRILRETTSILVGEAMERLMGDFRHRNGA